MEAARAARIERLPGLTNRVYRVELAGERFALRVPGEGTAAIIDRRVEEANARAAARAGVAPEVIHFGSDGVMLTRFVEGEPLTPESLKKTPARSNARRWRSGGCTTAPASLRATSSPSRSPTPMSAFSRGSAGGCQTRSAPPFRRRRPFALRFASIP